MDGMGYEYIAFKTDSHVGRYPLIPLILFRWTFVKEALWTSFVLRYSLLEVGVELSNGQIFAQLMAVIFGFPGQTTNDNVNSTAHKIDEST